MALYAITICYDCISIRQLFLKDRISMMRDWKSKKKESIHCFSSKEGVDSNPKKEEKRKKRGNCRYYIKTLIKR